MKNEKNIIEDIQNRRNYLIQLIFVSVIVAIAVNLLVYGITMSIDIKKYIYIIIGGVILVACLSYYLILQIKRRNKKIVFKGMFMYTNKTKNLLAIHGYTISQDMVKFLEAAFVENKAIESIWQKNSIGENFEKIKENPTTDIIIELLEYCVLENLSTFLIDYFNNQNLGSYQLCEYEREDIPDVLLKNRFLKLFTEPTDNREAFIDTENKGTQLIKVTGDEKLVLCHSYNGAEYRRFDLMLPNKTKISRMNTGGITLNMKNVELSFQIKFEGYNTFVSPDFMRYYVGKRFDKHDDYPFLFLVEVKVKHKIRSIFSRIKWIEYNWIDEYIDRLEKYLDVDEFYKIINWQSIKSNLHIMHNIIREEKKQNQNVEQESKEQPNK